MARYRCTQCDSQFGVRNVACPTEGCAGGLADQELVDARAERSSSKGRRSGSNGLGAFAGRAHGVAPGTTMRLGDADASDRIRIPTGIAEFDRVVGGGLVAGSLVLIAGEPGAGKTTLLSGVVDALIARGHRSIYFSGEENPGQIRLRAERLGLSIDELEVLCTDSAEEVAATIERYRPVVAVIDSIQTLSTATSDAQPGSTPQVRAATGTLMATAKATGTTLLIVGHVNKDNAIAGPKALEHLVDAVLLLEGERTGDLRFLRAQKNRFGATDEVGIFEMRDRGLIGVEALTPLHGVPGEAFGRAVCPTLVGERALLVEIQALVAKAAYNTGRRVAVGVSEKRLAMLLAVLERYADIDLSGHDVYLSTGGGLSIDETAADAAICAAVASSYWSTPLPETRSVWGEVALGGGLRESRAVNSRLKETKRGGFDSCVCPPIGDADVPAGLTVRGVSEIRLLLDELGVLRPTGAVPVASGRVNGGGNGGWWGGRKRNEGDDDDR